MVSSATLAWGALTSQGIATDKAVADKYEVTAPKIILLKKVGFILRIALYVNTLL